MKKIITSFITSILFFLNVNAQTVPTGLGASGITANTAIISWQASTSTPTISTKVESFEQPFGTQSWSGGGYNWYFDYNDDIRNYNGSAHSGSSAWYVRGYLGRSNLFCNTPINLKGLWIYSQGISSYTYTIKGFQANGHRNL